MPANVPAPDGAGLTEEDFSGHVQPTDLSYPVGGVEILEYNNSLLEDLLDLEGKVKPEERETYIDELVRQTQTEE